MGKKIIFILSFLVVISCSLVGPKKSTQQQSQSQVDTSEYYEIDKELIVTSNPEHSYPIEASIIVDTPPKSPTFLGKIKDNKSEIIERSFGQVVYQIPDTMIVLNYYEALVRISKNSQDVNIEKNINGKISKSSIRVESRMEVKLVDSEGKFEIREINNERQMVEDLDYTEWKFGVIPKKTGVGKINLVISIVVGDDVKEIVYEDVVSIKSNPTKQVKSWWDKNWITMLNIIIIPFCIWIFNIWKNRKKDENKEI